MAEPVGGECPACGGGGAGDRRVPAREMMFGLCDPFEYAECASCGALRLLNVPADPGRYYPREYHSFRPAPDGRGWKAWLRRRWVAHLLGHRNAVGVLLSALRDPPAGVVAVARTGVRPDAAVLDVGSGVYGLLDLLHEQGFTNLTAIDPYIPGDVVRSERYVIRKAFLSQVSGAYDLILLNHSLEHMPGHEDVLRTLRRLVKPAGVVVIRTPVAGRTWREHGAAWVELDAPRHLLVHTERSLRLLARRTGFEVDGVTYDATVDELWGTEQYRQGIPLMAPRSHLVSPRTSIFTRRQLRAYRRRIDRMNRERESGRASFILRPAGAPDPQATGTPGGASGE